MKSPGEPTPPVRGDALSTPPPDGLRDEPASLPLGPEFAAVHEQVANLLADARLLLWTARVRRIGDDYQWNLSVAPESLRSPLVEYTGFQQHGFFWHPDFAPDYQIADRTYREALARGADRYRQEFRVLFHGQTIWLDEVVRIVSTGPDEWRFCGLLRDITAQKLAQEAERRVTDELRRMMNHAQCMLWHGNVTDSTDGSAPHWELKFLPSALQRRIFDHIDPSATMRLYEAFDVPAIDEMHARSSQALRSGASGYQQEFQVTRKRDGQSFWIREHVAITTVAPGRWQVSGVMIDVTAQKVAELARRDTELQLRRLLEDVDCIVWSARLTPDPANQYHWDITAPPSRLYRRIFGREPGEPAKLWEPERSPDSTDMDRRWRRALAEGETGYEQEFRYNSHGTLYWLHENVTVLERKGDVIQLAGVVIDITEAKLAELQLAAEKERLAVTLRAMDEGVVTVDPHGEITFLNRAAEELLQLSAEQALGRRLSTVANLHVGQPPQPLAWPPHDRLADFPADAQLVRPTGDAVLVEGCSAPLHDPLSRLIGAVIVLRDVTERHLLQSHLQRASTLESVGLLAGGIAHDFNNILTALLANLSLAQMDVMPNTTMADYLREARAATDRASALARQLLTFAKGGDPLLAAVNLGDVIREVTRFTLRGARVDHSLEIPTDLWPARADRGQLAQIIQNLVMNAAQAMPQGGTICLAATNVRLGPAVAGALAPGRYVKLTVSDTGTGIPAEALDKIFTPYFTTKSQGHGLGLAVVYSIVKKHRGGIDVRSTPGQGTTFELHLPAADSIEPGAERPAATRAGTLKGRILIMDDEQAIVRVVGSFLQRLGLTVDSAADGQQAVERYREAFSRGEPYDVVIMDLTVPGKMGGREAIALLKMIDPNVRAIVASGYSSDPVLARYEDFGFAAVAAKPYDIEQLAAQISELLGTRS